MTYGWAILIIAVVLASLFQLGVFNSSSFSPRAPPGACQVFRPSGPGTVTNINLMGVCTGQLPQYVSVFSGQTSYVNSGNSAFLNPTSALSISAWVMLNTTGVFQGVVARDNGVWVDTSYSLDFGNDNKLDFRVSSTGAWTSYALNDVISTNTFSSSNWYHVAATYQYVTSGTSVGNVYVNGLLEKTNTGLTGPLLINTRNLRLGSYGLSYYLTGKLANAQVYNASLTANQVQALYLEGIGGVPLKLQNLVGWWPLNGNSNDYSGNNNNGVPANVVFTSQYGK